MAKKTTTPEAPAPKRRRADADRSVAAILDAGLEALASDPESSMSEIARRAGVVRATIYVHFPTRETLLDAVMEYAVGQVVEAMRSAEPHRGEPAEALARVLRATWRQLAQFHGLLALNTARLSVEELHRRRLPMLNQLEPLIERGQKRASFATIAGVMATGSGPVDWCMPRALRSGAAECRLGSRGRDDQHRPRARFAATAVARETAFALTRTGGRA